MLEKLAARGTPGVFYGKADVEKMGSLPQQLGVRTIPDTRIFFDGKQVGEFKGTHSEKKIAQLIAAKLQSVKPRTKVVAGESSGQGSIVPAKKGQLPPGITPIPAS